jgi:hypothetical protein
METKNYLQKFATSSDELALEFPSLGPDEGKLARANLPLAEIARMSEEQLLYKPITGEELERRKRSKSPERFVIKP